MSKSFVTGAVALVFAVLGYQTALLVHYAAVTKIAADRDRPDTIFVYETIRGNGEACSKKQISPGPNRYGSSNTHRVERKNFSQRSPIAQKVRENVPPRRVESFRFNPNTVSIEDLIRLGFTQKQAASIDNYRSKGGRFRRKSDFARSFVVSDSIFQRLEPYIDIPLLDINTADSAAFDALPGIGGYFARKMVEYRARLHGYSYPEQLMEIYHFDQKKFDALKDLITVSAPEPYPLWSFPEDSLRRHPYIGRYASNVVFYREHNPRELWTVEGLAKAGVIPADAASKLAGCRLCE